MSKRKIYQFLRDLEDNNSKQWMDAHRDRYEEARDLWIEECGRFLGKLAGYDDHYRGIEPRDTIERINNNLLYHPELPTYKNHFGFSPGSDGGTGLYVSVSPSYSFIGGGIHNPDNKTLKKLRAHIDSHGDELREYLDSKTFRDTFGELSEDPKKLKTAPQGYDREHEHIELLRRKDFTMSLRVSQEEVLADDFPDRVLDVYKKMEPLVQFVRTALAE